MVYLLVACYFLSTCLNTTQRVRNQGSMTRKPENVLVLLSLKLVPPQIDFTDKNLSVMTWLLICSDLLH